MAKQPKYKYHLGRFLLFVGFSELIFWGIAFQILSVFGFFSKQSTAENFTFLQPNYAFWLLLIPLLAIVFCLQINSRTKIVKQFGNREVITTVLTPIVEYTLYFRYFMMRSVIAFSVLALMQPVLGKKNVRGSISGAEIVFVVDVSNSMNSRDIKGGESRLTVAKRAMKETLKQGTIGRVGILVFAGSVYPHLPLTADKELAKMYIDNIQTNLLSHQGTNIAVVLEEASVFFSQDISKKILFLITDGEDHEGGMDQAFQKVKEKGIQSFVLGTGSEKGGIVLEDGRRNALPLRDNQGNPVLSRLNKQMIKEIAKNLEGQFITTTHSFPNLSQFLTEINKNTGGNSIALNLEVKANRYQWPLALALLSFFVLLVGEKIRYRKN